MERFSQRERESILLGYNHQRPSTNPSTPLRNSDVDFHDVFGGPPRRSSIQEMRYGIGEAPDFSASRMEEEGAWCAWPQVREKPVFGEDNLNRRRYASDNFYDDIFGGDESPCRTPMKHERPPLSSTPASRIMSPAPPLPPAHDSSAPSSLPSTLRFYPPLRAHHFLTLSPSFLSQIFKFIYCVLRAKYKLFSS